MTTPANHSLIELTDLLSSLPYRLAYDLPLFALSLLLAFAGAFLTLDRTRSFRPRIDPSQSFDATYLPCTPGSHLLYPNGGAFCSHTTSFNSPSCLCFWHLRSDLVDCPACRRPTLVKCLGAVMDK